MSVPEAIRNTIDNYGEEVLTKRGRPGADEWQSRARYLLRHFDDPIALQRSALCRLTAIEHLAAARFPNSVVPRGKALNYLTLTCLLEIENDLVGHPPLAKLKRFVELTRKGKGLTAASKELSVTPEHACRTLKRRLIQLLADKMVTKLGQTRRRDGSPE